NRSIVKMAVQRTTCPLVIILLLFLVGFVVAAKGDSKNDDDDDLPSLADCKAKVVEAMEKYWDEHDKNDDDDDVINTDKDPRDNDDAKDDDGKSKKEDDDDDDEEEKSKDNDGKEKKSEDDDDDDDDKQKLAGVDETEHEQADRAEVEEVVAADDFVDTEDSDVEDELEEVEVPQTGRDHIDKIMELDEEMNDVQEQENKLVSGISKDLKRLYDQTIKPIEQLYKYKDISARRFADAEIYSQPMILFVGPWNSGKSTIVNYLLDLEGTDMALETGAASAGSQFIVLSHANKEQKVDGTELAADWRFAGLQKFGQGFIDALIGRRIPRKLLSKITIVEAPGIRESTKNLNYPFDDALQWFIDRADIIYVVFDPTKLEMGNEVNLLMDQLKGREKYLRFLINKADTVDTQSITKVTAQLFWTLSPMLPTPTVPTTYTVSMWSKPYQEHSDGDFLSDQEVTMLRDMKKQTIDKLVENKLAHGRRYAVTVRNHAKLVDCYLTHYFKHKTLFANKNKVANEIIDNPDKYKIFEALSMLNNVSRYDLPNPEIYKGFFKVNPLYEFKQLKNTCSYFKGCPLDKLNVCIAYDLPQLLGKYKKKVKEIRDEMEND
ncbi:SRL (predicted), partial [Pycnogonum litorale]